MLKTLHKHHKFMVGYTRALLLSVIRPVIFYLVVMAFTAIGIGSTIFWFVEKNYNSNLKSFLDAIYFTTATMTTVGYGDITPVTTCGKILAIFFMLSGTAIFVCFTAVLSSTIVDIEMRSEFDNFNHKD